MLTPEISASVDCALRWLQVIRKLREQERRGALDRVTYLAISRDLEGCLERLTEELLSLRPLPKPSLLKRVWEFLWGKFTPEAQERAEATLLTLFGVDNS